MPIFLNAASTLQVLHHMHSDARVLCVTSTTDVTHILPVRGRPLVIRDTSRGIPARREEHEVLTTGRESEGCSSCVSHAQNARGCDPGDSGGRPRRGRNSATGCELLRRQWFPRKRLQAALGPTRPRSVTVGKAPYQLDWAPSTMRCTRSSMASARPTSSGSPSRYWPCVLSPGSSQRITFSATSINSTWTRMFT